MKRSRLIFYFLSVFLISTTADTFAQSPRTSVPSICISEPAFCDSDELNANSEINSLKIQAEMDRTSKFFETLSNTLKSISSDDSGLVGNIK